MSDGIKVRGCVEMDRERIREVWDLGVAGTVRMVRERSGFYREKFKGMGEVRGVGDLAGLPVTTKGDISRYGDTFWCVGRERVADISTTSGTTGVPTLYPMTEGDLERLGVNEEVSFERMGLGAGDVVILAVTVDKCFMAGLAYFLGLKKLGVTVVRVGAGSPVMLLEMAERVGATAVVSVPSFLKRVVEYAAGQGVNLRGLKVRKLICIGEAVRDAGMKLTALGERLEQSWGAKVFATYGVTELASSMGECEAGCGGHVHPELLYVEILGEDGKEAADGEVGQLVATTIGVEGLPVVRFATGDMTFMVRERCGCGRWSPRVGPILGRKDQAMKIKGTTVYPAAVQRALECVPGLVDYILVATTNGAGMDELEVVAAWRGDSAGAEEILREQLRGSLKVGLGVRLASVKEIGGMGGAGELRKQRMFLDRRSNTKNTK